jgi:hypothetical protein
MKKLLLAATLAWALPAAADPYKASIRAWAAGA